MDRERLESLLQSLEKRQDETRHQHEELLERISQYFTMTLTNLLRDFAQQPSMTDRMQEAIYSHRMRLQEMLERSRMRASQQQRLFRELFVTMVKESSLTLSEAQRKRGRHGGMKGAAHWHKVRLHALDAASKSMPQAGWRSAELAASEIKAAVIDYARLQGRDFPSDPQRTIAGWLRKAGIKRMKSTT